MHKDKINQIYYLNFYNYNNKEMINNYKIFFNKINNNNNNNDSKEILIDNKLIIILNNNLLIMYKMVI